jgi:hypothetical protein
MCAEHVQVKLGEFKHVLCSQIFQKIVLAKHCDS